MNNFEDSIRLARAAVTATPQGHPERASRLNDLREQLTEAYATTESRETLEESITIAREVVHAATEEHSRLADYLNNLAVELHSRYSETGDVSDLEEAIYFSRRAITTPSEENLNRIHRLNNLAAFLRLRAAATGRPEDLEEAIQISRQALAVTPSDSSQRAEQLHNLGALLRDEYYITEDPTTIEECIHLMRQSIHLATKTDPYFAEWMEALGEAIGLRYATIGEVSGIEEDISTAREYLAKAPDNSLETARWMSHLGQFLVLQYLQLGTVSSLEEAISLGRNAVGSTPESDAHYNRYMNNLGIWLSYRFQLLGTMADIDESIQITRKLIQATPDGLPAYAGLMNNLGNHLGDRFSRTKSTVDLDEALQVTKQGVDLTPQDHPSYTGWLNNLGNRYVDMFLTTHSRESLEDAIRIAREVIESIPTNHSHYIEWLSNLGTRLAYKYEAIGALAVLEETIQIAKIVLDSTSDDHLDRAERLNRLGQRLGHRYGRRGSPDDLRDAVSAHESALRHEASPIINRIEACREYISYREYVPGLEMREASKLMADLIPRLSPRSLDIADKQYMLSQVFGLTSEAAAGTLESGGSPSSALQMLEVGRGVIGTFFDELRTDIQALEDKHPELAHEFVSIRNKLDNPASRETMNSTDVESQRVERRRRADEAMDTLLAQIRNQPGFDSFLCAPSKEEIQAAAGNGPIVIINTSQYRCDAILVRQEEIQSLNLPALDDDDIDIRAAKDNLGSPKTLAWLWDTVAGPVLDALGFTQTPCADKWPHVWWICTGSLSKFPLHAAGYHSSGSSDAVCDRVMSSYSTSVKAIIRSRQRPLSVSPRGRALLVAVENSPSYQRLPFATNEIQVLQGLCPSMKLTPITSARCKQDILSLLPECDVFHFAGHGHSHGEDPSKSFLVLESGRKDPLTVDDLFAINLRKSPPFLAYLSACGTSQIRDKKFVDEGIHLASVFQLAGFRHVVGTLWQVNDEICVDVARIIYEAMRSEMRHGCMTDSLVCSGLHKATRELRDRWLATETSDTRRLRLSAAMESPHLTNKASNSGRVARDVVLDDDENMSLQWVPYIHFGA